MEDDQKRCWEAKRKLRGHRWLLTVRKLLPARLLVRRVKTEPRFKDIGKNVPAGSTLTKDYIYVRTAKRKTYRDETPTEYRLPPIRITRIKLAPLLRGLLDSPAPIVSRSLPRLRRFHRRLVPANVETKRCYLPSDAKEKSTRQISRDRCDISSTENLGFQVER